MSKNLMEMVAKELGVELEEEFNIKGLQHRYKITNSGFKYARIEFNRWLSSERFNELLRGALEIVKIPKFPIEGSNYYYINNEGNIIQTYFSKEYGYDVIRFKLGNFYLTKEEAEAHKQEWVDFYNNAERIEWK